MRSWPWESVESQSNVCVMDLALINAKLLHTCYGKAVAFYPSAQFLLKEYCDYLFHLSVCPLLINDATALAMESQASSSILVYS